MILQHNTGFSVADSDTLNEDNKTIFRVGCTEQTITSLNGESAYLSFNANETKSIALPLGYSSDNRLRFVGQTNGTLELTVTHPTLGAQTLTLKGGGLSLVMRASAISLTEKAGTSAWFQWSIMQTEATSTEVFS